MGIEGKNLGCMRGERLLFRDLNFAIDAGEALILRGANGSGKSSLLKIIATLLKQSAGDVHWQGISIAEEPDQYRRQIAYIGHLDAVKPALSVQENLQQWATIFCPGDQQNDARIENALKIFDIPHLAMSPAQHLSAGQRKRVALARILLKPASLWLLDEPTVSLDADGVERLARAIALHRKNGGLVMAATHIDLGLMDARELTIEAVRP
jgi:heme exporter protein A